MNTSQAHSPSRQARVEMLRSTPLFASLPQHALDDIALTCETVSAAPGEELFRQGDPATALFVLTSGRVEVLDTRGEVLRTLDAGTSFGEIGLITDAGRAATVRAADHCVLLKISRHSFQELLWADHEFTLAVLDAVARLLYHRRDERRL